MTKLDQEVEQFISELKNPYLTAIKHAGWKLWNIGTYERGEEFTLMWIAANSITGQVVEFTTVNDEPEADYEDAALNLIIKGHCKVNRS